MLGGGGWNGMWDGLCGLGGLYPVLSVLCVDLWEDLRDGMFSDLPVRWDCSGGDRRSFA